MIRRPGARHNRGRIAAGGAPLDTTAPTPVSAAVAADGLSLALTYGEILDETSVPDPGAYSVGSTYPTTVTSVDVSGSVVTLTTNQEIDGDATVTLSYTAGASPVRDLAGNAAANLISIAVTNGSTVVLETIIETLVTGTSWTPPYSQTITIDGWGGGGAGLRLIGGGGGGEHSRITRSVVKGVPESYALGAAGAAPSGNGGNTTWGSTLLIATGGSGAVSAGGAGGTGGAGDSTHDGGQGGTGTGTVSGGGGGGSATAASGTTPGTPDGAACVVNTDGTTNGAGGGSAAIAERAGAPGRLRIVYVQPAAAGYPYPVAWAFGRDTANATSRALTIPGAHVDGDRLLYFVASDGAVASLDISGATAVAETEDGTATVSIGVYEAASSASPPATLASASEQTAWIIVRVRGAAAVEGAVTSGDSTNADPPSLTPATLPANYLLFTPLVFDSNGSRVSAMPSGYQLVATLPIEAVIGGVQLTLGMRKAALSAAENPGASTSSTEQWCAGTVIARAS